MERTRTMVLHTYAKALLARTVSRVLFGGRRKNIAVSTHSQLNPLRSFLFYVELHGVARSFAVVNVTLFIRDSPSAVVIVFAPAVTYRKNLCELGITFVGVLSQGGQVLHSSWCAGFYVPLPGGTLFADTRGFIGASTHRLRIPQDVEG